MKDCIVKKVTYHVNESTIDKFAVVLADRLQSDLEGGMIIGKLHTKDVTRYFVYDRVPPHAIGLGLVVPNKECEDGCANLPGSYREVFQLSIHKDSLDIDVRGEFVAKLGEKLSLIYPQLIAEYKLPVCRTLHILKNQKRVE